MRLYECKLTRIGLMESGKEKKLTESYLVDALTVCEAVTAFEAEMGKLFRDYETLSVKRTNFSEFVDNEGDKFYKVKYNLLSIDERTGAEIKNAYHLIMRSTDIHAAKQQFDEYVKTWVVDVDLESISETKIVDIVNKG